MIAGLIVVGQAGWYLLAVTMFPPTEANGGLGTGEFGDIFGGYNALVAGVALAFIVYSIVQQSKDLDFQRDALDAQRKELKLQRGEMRAQREETEQARLYRDVPVVMITDLSVGGNGDKLDIVGQLSHFGTGVAWDVRLMIAPRYLNNRFGARKTCSIPVLAPSESSSLHFANPPVDMGPPRSLLWSSVRYRNVAGGRFHVVQAFELVESNLTPRYFRVQSGDNVHDGTFDENIAATGFRLGA